MTWPFKTPEPGVYFNMSFEEYLAIPCLQSTALKNLLISGAWFWTHSWMNPLHDEIDTDSKAKLDGRAYHCRILEGKDEFLKRYAPEFEYTGKGPLINSVDGMKQALIAAGLPSTVKSLRESGQRLLQARPDSEIEVLLRDDYESRNLDKEFIKQKTWRQIEFAAHMIEAHPEIRECFKGGYPEVTCIFDLWGVRFKCRFDYMKVNVFTDLKTFANIMEKNIEQAVNTAFAARRYHISAALYLVGHDAAREHIKAGRVHHAEAIDPMFLDLIKRSDPVQEAWFVFQHKGISPDCDWIRVRRESKIIDQGLFLCGEAAGIFRANYEHFNDLPWLNPSNGRVLEFDDLPSFVNDV